jgi:hypothetical protein
MDDRKYKTLAEIAAAVDAQDGIMTLFMWQVRDAHGAGRLGVNVCTQIASEFEEFGILHNPSKIPSDQWAMIRLWRGKSAVGRLIRATRKVGYEYDEQLRKAAAGEAHTVLAKVAALVSDHAA